VIFATGSGLMHVDLVDRSVAGIDPNAPDLLAEISSVLPLSEMSDPVRS
jgi:hypothetical protein